MFKEIKSRRLALLVAVALGGGGFLSSAQNVSAADVTIDDAHPTVAAEHKVGTDGAAGGAITDASSTVDVTGNTLTLTKRAFTGRLYGGYTAGSGKAVGNKVSIHNETTHLVQESVYGGFSQNGNASGNEVTLTGGTFSSNIYGGASGGGAATGNTVNLGDGKKIFSGSIHGTVYGGDSPTGDNVTGNVLNVNTNVIADNIKNFATINFNYNSTVSDGTMLQLDDNANKRTSVDWNGIHLTGTPDKALTLMSNSNGIDISNYGGGIKHLTLTDTHEGYVAPSLSLGGNRYQVINYERNQFAGVRKNNVNTSTGTPGLSEVDVYGGFSAIGNTTTDNEVTITNAPGHGKVYGGYTEGDQTTADVSKRYDSKGNKVTITGGAATELYGGYTASTAGVATGNTVTVKGGTVRQHVYGGYSVYGNATGNTVNLGDGESASVGAVQGTIFGGRSMDNAKDQTTGNTLNVNANATALNIKNFSTINFNFKHVNTSNPLLTLNDPTDKTKLKSLDQLHVKNAKVGQGTLIRNANGIDLESDKDVGRTGDKTETIIKRTADKKEIFYRTYQFKESTEKDTDGGLATWGGRSLLGNTTTKNEITLTDNRPTQSVYGGWTTKVSTIKTEGSAEGHSIGNKITFNGGVATDTVKEMFGGLTAVAGGSATGNRAVLKRGKVTHSLTGGSAGATGGSATSNFVDINDGEVGGATYGGYSGGKAEKNEVTLTNGTAKNLYGGFSDYGSAEGNKVKISGGTAQIVHGGKAAHGNAAKNIVEITGGAVNQIIYGGEAGGSGKAEGNTVTLTNGTVGSDVLGGLASSGDAVKNIVNINGGSVGNHDVYGGWTTSGKATGNIVTVTGGSVRNVVGGKSAGEASDNTVTVGNVTVNSIKGGEGATTKGNTVNINNTTVTDKIVGGTAANNDADKANTLNVKGVNTAQDIEGVQKLTFDAHGVAEGQTMLTLSNGGATKVNWNTLTASGMAVKKITLLKKTAGSIDLEGYNGSAKSEITGGNTETNIDVVKNGSGHVTDITYQGYQFKGMRGNAAVDGTDVYGGRSKAGNTTTDNDVTVDSGSHTNAYGGWTSGSGTVATGENARAHSMGNKVTVKGTAAVSGTVYGGLTESVGGNATGNEVTIEKSITGGVVGGKAAGDASGNTVTVKANTGAVTGGDGATTNNNTVNLEGGVTVNGTAKGGTQENGTGNTLNVKGQNSAQSVEGFQKMNFNTNGVAAGGTMLNVTGGAQTKVNWNTLTAGGNGRNISLLKANSAIDFGGTYTAGTVKSGLSVDKKSETNISVTEDKKEIKYTGYQFTGVTTASVDGTKAYGGVSKAGNATHHNNITVNGNYTEVYGGHTSGTSNTDVEKKNSHDNTVTITGGTLGKVYGGYTDVDGGTTENNTVNLGDGTNALAPSTTIAEIHGGNKSAKGNTLNVNTAATVGKIENFSTVAFKNAASKLTLTQAGANFDLDSIKADFAATENEVELVENANGLTLKDGKAFRSDLSTDGTKETNIEARDGNKKIVRYGYTIKGATTATTRGTEMWGGRSAAGNTTTGNAITVNDSGNKKIYGGYTSGAGTSAADKNDSHTNKVTLTGGNYDTVYGGWTNVGKAVSNTVNVTANAQGTLVGGYSASGEASNNVVSVMNAAFTGNITGGQGAVTNYNVIRLRNASVSGTITGGTAANGKDNTLDVSYGTGTSSSVGDITNIQRLHFDMENAPVGNANPLLKLTNVSGGGDKNLTGMKFAVARSGATKKLAKGDTFTLMENTTAPGKKITVGSGVTAEGRDGVSRNYTFDVSTDATGRLIATVTKAGMGEQSKSIVETRAGASAFLNDGGDFLVRTGMDAAQKAARAAAQAGSAPYGLWAGVGAGSLRHKTGSYVDMKGWNLGVGWARENAVPAGSLTFGPFIEYGRGNYDSYLDDGTHGSGKTSFFGAGVMARVETGSHWVDGSLRIGRTKSDYTGLATYDTTSTYYGAQVGAGKDFHMNETDTVGVYARYAYSHTAGTSAHLSSGETYDFDAVNSQRLRIGTRYTHGMADFAQFYAGLAWEYEFDGDARATSQGDSAPSPSLKGGSALLELGYRFAPQGSRMSYDLHLNGWKGKRQGVTGGASVKWAF